MQTVKFLRPVLLISIILSNFILSCAKHVDIHISNMEQLDYMLEYDNGNVEQLSAVCSENYCKFVVFNILGMPIVSKECSNNKLKNNKFLPPNINYDKLFVYIVNSKGKQKQFFYKVGDMSVNVYKNN